MGTLLGFDYGPRKIGVAVGQTLTASASPLTTLRVRNGRPDWEAIGRMIAEWRPQEIVVGIPYHMDDTEAEPAKGARRFAHQIEGRYHLPVRLVDERLTSREARDRLGRRAVSREAVDAMAAKLIVETWLSEHA